MSLCEDHGAMNPAEVVGNRHTDGQTLSAIGQLLINPLDWVRRVRPNPLFRFGKKHQLHAMTLALGLGHKKSGGNL